MPRAGKIVKKCGEEITNPIADGADGTPAEGLPGFLILHLAMFRVGTTCPPYPAGLPAQTRVGNLRIKIPAYMAINRRYGTAIRLQCSKTSGAMRFAY